MPRLWESTIEAHRKEVREAVIATTAALVADRGLRTVTMSDIATETGIGRATLYKYFSDVEAILVAWHERQLSTHVAHLEALRSQAADPEAAIVTVVEAYARIQREHPGGELAALLHRREHGAAADRRLQQLLSDAIADGAAIGAFRTDVDPSELAAYVVHALTAARHLPSKAAARRLAVVVVDGLRPSSGASGPARSA